MAAAALIICCIVPSRARAQAEHPSPRGDDGRIWYEDTPCHGVGGGPGCPSHSKQPIDLRTRPASWRQRPREYLAGGGVRRSQLASAHSAVWEKIRTDAGMTARAEIAAHGIVVMIADYVISIQAK